MVNNIGDEKGLFVINGESKTLQGKSILAEYIVQPDFDNIGAAI